LFQQRCADGVARHRGQRGLPLMAGRDQLGRQFLCQAYDLFGGIAELQMSRTL